MGETYFSMNMSYPGELSTWSIQPTSIVVIKIIAYSLIMLLSLCGNILVIFVLACRTHLRSTTNIYLVNLAVCDLLILFSCPWVYLVDDLTIGWKLGAFFCKFNPFAQVSSLVFCVYMLMIIACDRFFGIVFVMRARVTRRRSSPIIVCGWVLAMSVASPILYRTEQYERHWTNYIEKWCQEDWPMKSSYGEAGTTLDYGEAFKITNTTDNADSYYDMSEEYPVYLSRAIYFISICIVLYFIPILVMVVTYGMIIFKVWRSEAIGARIESEMARKSRMKRKMILMLLVLMFAFIICWTPLISCILYSQILNLMGREISPNILKMKYFAEYMMCANAALNPIIYTGMNGPFKRELRNLMTQLFNCRRCRERKLKCSPIHHFGNNTQKTRYSLSSIKSNVTPIYKHRSTSLRFEKKSNRHIKNYKLKEEIANNNPNKPHIYRQRHSCVDRTITSDKSERLFTKSRGTEETSVENNEQIKDILIRVPIAIAPEVINEIEEIDIDITVEQESNENELVSHSEEEITLMPSKNHTDHTIRRVSLCNYEKKFWKTSNNSVNNVMKTVKSDSSVIETKKDLRSIVPNNFKDRTPEIKRINKTRLEAIYPNKVMFKESSV